MKQKITFVISLIFGLLFIVFGLNKFMNFMPAPEKMPEKMMAVMGAFMQIGWLMPLVGAAEIVGGLLIIFRKTRALGALICFPVMVGIVLTNTVTDTSGFPIAAVFSILLIWIMYDNRAKYMPLIGE